MIRSHRRACWFIALALAIMTGGCHTAKPVSTGWPGLQTAPLEPMASVVAQINSNNAPIKTLWANHSFEADLVDENGAKHFINGDGVLLFEKPGDLLMRGTHTTVKIFEIGSNPEQYWLFTGGDHPTQRQGRYENLGKPCTADIPIRPDLILQVLGITDIDIDLNALPAPTVRFNPDQDCYMFVWSSHLPDRWVAQREIWYDRATKLPMKVILFDEKGLPILRANLSAHKPIEASNSKVATQYQLYFPANGSSIKFNLFNLVFKKKNVPNPTIFTQPQPEDAEVIQLDKGCE